MSAGRLVPVAIVAVAVSITLAAAHVPSASGQEGAPGKFEEGFYSKIQGIIGSGAAPLAQRSSPEDDLEYVITLEADQDRRYHVIILVGGDGDEEVRRNKAAIVAALEGMGARDIAPAASLPFVTASVPVTGIPRLSLHGAVAGLGDGGLPVVPQVNTARQTIRATAADLSGISGDVINGSGVTVAVVDDGINSIYLNDKVAARVYCPGGSCGFNSSGILFGTTTLNQARIDELNSPDATHGTLVAQVIAGTGLRFSNGLAPGVALLDTYVKTSGEFVTAIDWALAQGADVANLSIGLPGIPCSHHGSVNWAINEVVRSGMVVVLSTANEGYSNGAFVYRSATAPNCAYNQISVGGVNDRGQDLYLYYSSSKGPTDTANPRLVPHLAAPAAGIPLNTYTTHQGSFTTVSGTSFAVPMVSSAAAMMLQLEPDLTPTETKSLMLIGADWTGPVPCTSARYEASNSSDGCSHAARQSPMGTADTRTLDLLNHVGFGVLDVAASLEYVKDHTSYVASDRLDSGNPNRLYGLNVTGTDTVKVVLTWLASHPGGGFSPSVANLDFTVTCPGPGRGGNPRRVRPPEHRVRGL